jgi:non-ribosomal peptide synthetase component F/pyruvate-formate lyase-activating enzyme
MRDNNISRQMKIAASQNIKEREYWLNQLSGHPGKSFFPYDRQVTTSDERCLHTVNFQLSGELFSNLVRISGNSDKRLHMIMAAGLAALLNKYTGDQDIIVGMPIYKQETGGKFINTVLPLRIKPKAHMTFKQLVLQVRQITSEAAENQNYPMKTLLYKLNIPSSDTTGFALFDAAILLENIHDKSYLADINYNMLFSLLRTAESIQGQVEYNDSLYEKATIQRIISHYRQLFQVVFSNPDIPLEEIDILPKEEKHRILFDFNDTNMEYPQDKTIHAWLETQVEKTPDQIALVKNHQYLTYRELNKKANQLAGLLREKGLKPEGIVGIIMEPSLELIIGIVGILKAGGAYLPIDSEYPETRILSILRDSCVSILLTKESLTRAMTFIALKDFKESNVKPVVTSPRGQVKDFDSLPFLDRTLIDYDKYHQYIGVAMARHKISFQASRGCPFNCIYCHKIWPRNHVARSAENIFEEVKNCYDAGVRRFVFIDDVINFKKDNISRFLEKVIKSSMKLQLFFTNGLRGDILTKEIIDLMVEAGAVNIDMALESASPRMQKLIRKHLNLEKLRENIHYIAQKYPQVILEMEMLIGYPTETEEEALMTLQFAKDIKWLHFPKLHILKFFPGSEMYQLAREKGISEELLERSTNLAFHELPETLPYSKAFTRQFQARLMNEYFFNKERLIQVLNHQLKILTENELVQKYDSYLPMEIRSFSDILEVSRLSTEELGGVEFLPPNHMAAPNFREKMKKYFPPPPKEEENALRVLLLDLSSSFSSEKEAIMSYQIEEPMGLAFLLTYIKKIFDRKICGKIGKARIDFDDFDRMKTFIRDFNPDLIGLRTLSYYKDFFHKCISLIRQWGINVPIISGGPYATSDYQLMLNDSHIDVAVLGEGELTLAHLLEKIIENDKKLPDDEALKKIPGIAFIKKEDKTSIKKVVRDVVLLDNIRELVAPYPEENPVHINNTTDFLYMVSTSGSTGTPKSLMMEHRSLANLMNFQFRQTAVNFKRVLQFASIGFDVSSQEIFSTLLAGGQLYLIDSETKRNVYRLLEWIGKNHLNVIYWPPALLKYVFSEPEHRARFPKSI